MVNYGKVLGGSLKFSVAPKRWVPLFALDAVFFTSALAYIIANIFMFKSIVGSGGGGLAVVSTLIGAFLVLFAGFIIWMLLRLYVSGAIIHQSAKPKEFNKSWTVSRQRYLSLLAVVILISALSFIVGMVLYIGWILSIIVSIVFLFSIPVVVVKRMSFDDALREGYKIFRKKPGEVFLAWLLITIVSGIIVLIFFTPMVLAAWSVFMPILIGAGGNAAGLLALISNGWSLVPFGLVCLVGLAITNVFALCAVTRFYPEFKKKWRII